MRRGNKRKFSPKELLLLLCDVAAALSRDGPVAACEGSTPPACPLIHTLPKFKIHHATTVKSSRQNGGKERKGTEHTQKFIKIHNSLSSRHGNPLLLLLGRRGQAGLDPFPKRRRHLAGEDGGGVGEGHVEGAAVGRRGQKQRVAHKPLVDAPLRPPHAEPRGGRGEEAVRDPEVRDAQRAAPALQGPVGEGLELALALFRE